MIDKLLEKPLLITIEGEMYEWYKQYITGAELKNLAGLTDNQEIYLSLTDPWDDELIQENDSVNLARPGIENFFIKRQLVFFINDVRYEWDKQYIKGKQLRKLGCISIDDDIFLKVSEPYDDELVNDDDKVDLARPGAEYFFSKEKPINCIIVNGREKEWSNKHIIFNEVIRLAYPNPNSNSTAYTVTYSRGTSHDPEGSMVQGDIVCVKNKMIFNVTATNKS